MSEAQQASSMPLFVDFSLQITISLLFMYTVFFFWKCSISSNSQILPFSSAHLLACCKAVPQLDHLPHLLLVQHTLPTPRLYATGINHHCHLRCRWHRLSVCHCLSICHCLCLFHWILIMISSLLCSTSTPHFTTRSSAGTYCRQVASKYMKNWIQYLLSNFPPNLPCTAVKFLQNFASKYTKNWI